MNGLSRCFELISRSALIFAFMLISSLSAFSQGRQATLHEIDQSYQSFRNEADRRILNYLKKNPDEKITFYRNHAVYLMVDVSESGIPLYFKTDNAVVATSLNVQQLRTGGSLGINMLGTGVKLGTWDGGRVRTDHVELIGRVTIGDGASSLDEHATHTTGTMIASGVNSLAKGMAPGATLIAFDFANDVFEMTQQAKADQTSIILSNHSYGALSGWESSGSGWSWHGDPAVNTTIDYKFGYYDSQAQQWDGIAFNAPYYLIVKAAGNDRSDTGDGSNSRQPDGSPLGFDCIPTYGVAKNILTVGAVNKLFSPYTGPSDVTMTAFSSWGPTDDGRIKPDLVAPGLNVLSSTSGSTTEYQSFNGTSMSTPAVTGTLTLLQQLYKSLNSGNYMRSATLKALAIHTAHETGANPGPDYAYGWGLLDAEGAAKVIINKDNQNVFIKEAVLASGQTFEMDLGIPKTATKIKATLVWTDPAGVPHTPQVNNPTKKLVNDLDLRLVDAGAITQFPWKLNPASPQLAATLGDNTLDNVEKIEFSPTVVRNYKLQITNKGTLQGGIQAFSLILEYSSQVDPLTTYYWIGNGGSWEDGSHWSLASGGVAANAVPTSVNRVVFDEKSFTVTNSTVSVNANESITSLRWFGKQFPVNFSMNGNTLSISENMTMLTDQVTTSTSGTINFTSAAATPNAVDLNTNLLDKITLNFNGNSSWALTGTASLDKITVAQGSVVFNGTVLKINQLASTGTSAMTFNASSFQALQSLNVDFTGATLLSDNASSIVISPAVTNTINVSSIIFQGLINVQGDVSISGTGQVRSIQGNGIVRLNGNLLVSNLNLSGGSQLILEQGKTQTFTDKIVFATSSSLRVTVKSSTASKATLAFSNYFKICVDNIDVSNVDVDITNKSVVNAGLGSTLTNSLNWLNVDCSNVLFPDFVLSNACVKASTYFTDASSGPIVSRAWTFGDPSSSQNSSALVSPLHYYATAGSFTATLTVNGASGSRSISKQVILTVNDLVDNTVQLNNGSLISTVVAQGYQWLKDGQIVSGATARSFSFGTTPSEYSVLIFSNSCNKRSAPFLITAVEEAATQSAAIKIYPNPTSDFLQIESSSAVLGTSLMDAVGREIRLEAEPMNEGRYRLNVTSIPSGLYILKIVTREKADLQKVIIRK